MEKSFTGGLKDSWLRSSAAGTQWTLPHVTGSFVATKCKSHRHVFFLAKEQPCGGHIVQTFIPRGSSPLEHLAQQYCAFCFAEVLGVIQSQT